MDAALLNHLWQSTLFALAAWGLTLVLRHYPARTRFWIWFAVTLKFLIPFSALTALGWLLRPASVVGVELVPQSVLSATLHVAQPVSMTHSMDALPVIWMIWAAGFAFVLTRWLICWLRVRSAVQGAPLYYMDLGPMDLDIEVRVSTEFPEPGVFGIREPVLLLPSAVVSRLSSDELDAIIAHELSHVRHRDNLTAAVHMFVAAVFWFYPLVWWVGRQLLQERERACDEAVVELGVAPRIYAAGILNACRLALNSRLGVVAGASGSNLAHRLAAILSPVPARKLSHAGRACLVAFALISVALPVLSAFAMPRAQSERQPVNRRFDSAWIEVTPASRLDTPRLNLTSTQLSMRNTSLRKLISVTYGLSERQVIGGPPWLDEHYDIEASTTDTIHPRMILELLGDKYGLRFIEYNLGEHG